MRNYTYSKGFSLVELMVVVAIIGVLAAIAIPNYQRYMFKARMAEIVSKAEGLISLSNEYISTAGTCAPREPGFTTVITPDVPSAWYMYIGDDFNRTTAANPVCAVLIRSNAASFGNADFQIWYTSPSLSTLNSATQSIRWICHMHLINVPNPTSITNIMPTGCIVQTF